MAKEDGQQPTSPPEQEIEVDLDAADPSKTITRRAASEIATQVRDDAGDTTTNDKGSAKTADESKTVKDLRRRMGRMQRNFDQRQADIEARHQREIADLRGRLDKVSVERQDTGTAAADAAHESAMAAMQTELTAAIERGDSAKQAELTRKMMSAEQRYWAEKARSAGVATRESTTTQQQSTTTDQRQQTTGPTVAGSRFINANEDWWDDPEYAIERQYANQLFTKLTGPNGEGYDKNDDETFREIARRVKQKFPTLEVKPGREDPEASGEDDDQAGEGEQQRQPNARRQHRAGGTNFQDRGSANSGNARRGRRVITLEEQKSMRAVGMNPDDNAHVMRWLREAEALERVGQ